MRDHIIAKGFRANSPAMRKIGIALLFLCALVPAAVDPSLVFPFITIKAYLFRLLVTGAFLCAVIPAVYRPKNWPGPVFWGFLGVVIASAISCALADIPRLAFTSTVQRMGGWIELAFLLLYYCAATMLLRTERLWRAYFWVFLAGSIPVNGLALYEAWLWPGARITSTLGNPSYLGTYSMLMVFLALFLANSPAMGRRATGMAYSMAFINAGVVCLTQTRAALLGLFLGLLAVFWREYRVATLVIAGIGWFGLLALDPDLAHRFSHLGSNAEQGVNIRLDLWAMTVHGIALRPWFGWGQEGFQEMFFQYATPALRAFSVEPFDRAHNLELDWLVAGGMVGLTAYAALIGLGMRAARATPGLFGFFVAYLVNGQFIFDTTTSYLLLAAVLACVSRPECNASCRSGRKG